MRTRWEDGGKVDLDEPANITERQFRSLRRGARAGRLAILLALVSAGAAGWSLIMGPDSLAGLGGIQEIKLRVLSAIGREARAEDHRVPVSEVRTDGARASNAVQGPSIPAASPTATGQDSSAVGASVANRR